MPLCDECKLDVNKRKARRRNGLAFHARCLKRLERRLARLGAVHRVGAIVSVLSSPRAEDGDDGAGSYPESASGTNPFPKPDASVPPVSREWESP
jgi:hypothetical protein